MTPFLAAQAADPFDPVPMLILADHLEEQGDLAGAGVLRGLAEAGMPSVAALALEAGAVTGREVCPDRFHEGQGDGLGDRLGIKGGQGVGHGDDTENTILGSSPGFGWGGTEGDYLSGGDPDPDGWGEGLDEK